MTAGRSSGIQILPAIKPEVRKLFNFVRQPTWVAPPFMEEYRKYTREEIQAFALDPDHHLNLRRKIDSRMNGGFDMFIMHSAIQKSIQEDVKSSMIKKLDNQELSDLLIPKFPYGCRRGTPGPDYLESLSDEKVQTVFGNIDRISEEGVVSENGTVYPVDVLICATGFDATYKPCFPIVGSSGRSLSDAWEDEVQGYLGLSAPDYPNYFMTLGPNSPVGNGPLLIGLELQVSYIVQMLSKFQKENVRSFEVSSAATESFNRWKDEYMKKMVWTEDCRSWYKAGSKSGRVVALWPGSTLHYLEAIKAPRYEDWKWCYQKGVNPWAFLGNGRSTAEKRPGGDLAWYLTSQDDSPVDVCLKGREHEEGEGEGEGDSDRGLKPKL